MAQKISNDLLVKIIEFGAANTGSSLPDCAKSLDLNGVTLSSWHRNFKTGKWPLDYAKTADKQSLTPALATQFIEVFSFSGAANKILKRLVAPKCLKNKYCFAKQHKILKRLFKKYPNVDFWLSAHFGEPRDDILLFLGKGEHQLQKKYLDFHATDDYTPFEYTYTSPAVTEKRDVKPKTLWDYYK